MQEAVVAVTDLRKRLLAATATLLSAASASQASQAQEPWTWDASFLQYNEADRIRVSEPQIGVRRAFSDQRVLSVLATIDTISGSTPLGTLPHTQNTAPVSTVTSASGHAVNREVGRVPLSEMKDTRLSLATTYERPTSAVSRTIVSGTVSKEHDFLSFGGSYTWNRDFNSKNTTLAVGASPEFDLVTPNGGLPNAYGPYQAPGEFERQSRTKYLVSGLIGITQVINRKTLMQWNYSPTYENGYLNDPYKLLSITNNQGDPLSTIHEKRPGYRIEHSWYWLTRYNIRDQDVFSLGFRYYRDDWGIRSKTLDFTYRWQYHEKRFFEPVVRYYRQSASGFFHAGLRQAEALPEAASADYRLSEITGVTFGARMGWILKNGSELTLRAEYYSQTGENTPASAVGAQRAYDLFPALHATILQVAYSFETPKFIRNKFSSR